MSDLQGIIKKRAAPGILLFDLDYRLLYSNSEAMDMLAAVHVPEEVDVGVPDEIYHLCRHLKEASGTAEDSRHYPVLKTGEACCSLRGFLLNARIGMSNPGQIVILMERVVEKHEVDMEKARLEFHLTKREAEVVELMCRGMGNRDIAEKMYISEYTVKDHMKNVMKKMNVGSRSEMMALLK